MDLFNSGVQAMASIISGGKWGLVDAPKTDPQSSGVVTRKRLTVPTVLIEVKHKDRLTPDCVVPYLPPPFILRE